MSKAVSIRLPDELVEQLENVARDTERSRSFIVQRAIESYLEDYADLQVALDRLRDKDDRVVSGDELRKSLGL
ncbi:ribbon-helix-helix protein, CopG family [bacterium]|jgi:RHH-type rel operon transcriptional repressor/antitoxin RelB|nr:ribbon-helix-helix protein, CopG family [bacterium]